jgi:hypothetical protein
MSDCTVDVRGDATAGGLVPLFGCMRIVDFAVPVFMITSNDIRDHPMQEL